MPKTLYLKANTKPRWKRNQRLTILQTKSPAQKTKKSDIGLTSIAFIMCRGLCRKFLMWRIGKTQRVIGILVKKHLSDTMKQVLVSDISYDILTSILRTLSLWKDH